MGTFRAVPILKEGPLKHVASRQDQVLTGIRTEWKKIHCIPPKLCPQTRHKHTSTQREQPQRAVSTRSLRAVGEHHVWRKFMQFQQVSMKYTAK